MIDQHNNPSADAVERKIRSKKFTGALVALIKEHADAIGFVSDNSATLYRTLLQSCIIAVLTVQTALEPDKTKTVRSIMREQFVIGKAAYASLAEANADVMDKPPRIETEEGRKSR